MSKLPVNIVYHSKLSLFLRRLNLAFKVLTQKKVAVIILEENKNFYKTNFFEMTNEEMAKSAKLTLMNLSKDEDLKSKLTAQLPSSILTLE